ncbi:hypothetical protein LWC35_21200 [Pseudonocardia kujensis]|uniref:hypothetical protein n=1 Tax=Pseudonocardia kujensis TaxID=1128675 RepID=UPI001E3BC10C|nr:hypothetical protein [Pseudonocardia kujensis]MCE0765399.1 hypothetical protein [Pseudonocardia kujensis]
MLVRTDDEVYRVDSVWLGPPRATFPWRARYVSYGVGLLVMIVIMFVQRRIGIGLDFFSVAWALVLTVVATRFLGKKIDYERPLSQVAELFRHEVTGPRQRRRGAGGPVRFAHVRTHRALPRAGRSGRPSVPEPRPAVRAEPEPAPEPAPQAVDAAPVLRDVTPVRAAPRRVGRTASVPQPWATSAQRRGAPGKASGKPATNGWKGAGRGRA